MESSAEKSKRKDGFGSLTDSAAESRESSTSSSRSSSGASIGEVKGKECSSPAPVGWPIRKAHAPKSSIRDVSEGECNSHDSKLKNLGSKISG